MAISVGTITDGTFTGPGNGTTVTINNINQNSGSNRYMYVVLEHQNNFTPTVTYGGASMTKFLSYSGQGTFWDVYELQDPAEGNNSLVFTYTAFQEYGTNIAYMTFPCTGANGYGNTATASGAATTASPLSVNISSVSSGSAVFLTTSLPQPSLQTQKITIDGTDTTSGFEFSQQVGTANYATGDYKLDVSSGTNSISNTPGYNMAGVAVEVLAAAEATSRRIFVIG